MSLKDFHIVFILCSIAVSAGFGAWAVKMYQQTTVPGYGWSAGGAFVTAILLTIYEIVFIIKLRKIETHR